MKKNMDEVWRHIEMTNSELGSVKQDVATIKSDIEWIKNSLNKQDSRTWYIVTGILISIGITIISLVI
jgi:peptidoglycan hydrolase CwlO-like protein